MSIKLTAAPQPNALDSMCPTHIALLNNMRRTLDLHATGKISAPLAFECIMDLLADTNPLTLCRERVSLTADGPTMGRA